MRKEFDQLVVLALAAPYLADIAEGEDAAGPALLQRACQRRAGEQERPPVTHCNLGLLGIDRNALVQIQIGEGQADRVRGLAEQAGRGAVAEHHGVLIVKHQYRIGRCLDRAADKGQRVADFADQLAQPVHLPRDQIEPVRLGRIAGGGDQTVSLFLEIGRHHCQPAPAPQRVGERHGEQRRARCDPDLRCQRQRDGGRPHTCQQAERQHQSRSRRKLPQARKLDHQSESGKGDRPGRRQLADQPSGSQRIKQIGLQFHARHQPDAAGGDRVPVSHARRRRPDDDRAPLQEACRH